VRAISSLPCSLGSVSTLSPNKKRHIARCIIWSVAATALLAELSYLAAERLA
jgi:hypothetical protein